MRSTLCSIVSFLLITEANALLSIPFTKVDPSTKGSRRSLQKKSISVAYLNQFPVYVVDITLGTPPQSIQVQLDTGSSDLVVETSSSDLCTSDPTVCSGRGAYNANASTTYQYRSSDLVILYGGGDGATGDYATDHFSIGSASLTGFEFGIMYKSTVLEGILGVGFEENEFTTGLDTPRTYPNLPVSLVTAGYIPSRAFSLYLNDDQDPTGGTLLFGGVDTEKYCGPLAQVPMVPDPRDPGLGIIAYFVALSGINAAKNGVTHSFASGSNSIEVLLDSGTTLTQLPSDLAAEIFTYLGATYDPASDSLPEIPCSTATQDITINFNFGPITIKAPISQFVVFPDSGTCNLGILPTDDTIILGDTFLSSAYTVYDLDNKVIYLAQAKFSSNSENILEIEAGVDGVPHPSVNCGGSTTTTTTTTTTTHTTTKPTITTTKTTTKKTTTTTKKPTTTKKVTTTAKKTTTKCTTKKTTTKPTTTKKTTMKTTTKCTKKTTTKPKPKTTTRKYYHWQH
ncbi:hypothetical protein TWF694_004510 [Orbilia ellipsospora]|uniref:Peptidase A1 domain-containing protein n=1 Tax=Orbilia ellipsospora TaxID=2528407 RepID=A0AAV9WWR5_9PEZI